LHAFKALNILSVCVQGEKSIVKKENCTRMQPIGGLYANGVGGLRVWICISGTRLLYTIRQTVLDGMFESG
jgi:hypothetical protein